MADRQEYGIDIVTRATGTGAEETEAKLARLQSAGVFAPSAGSAEALSAAEKQAAIESQIQKIAATRLELTLAQTSGDKATAAVLANQLKIHTAILGAIRAETLTQADLNALFVTEEVALGAAGVTGKAATEGIAAGGLLAGANMTKARQEGIVLVRELTTGGNVTRTLGSLLSAFPIGITLGAIAGIGLFEAIKKTNAETNKLIGETAQLGDELDKAAKKWQEGARAALTPEDVRKIADAAIPELDKVHAKVSEIQRTTLSLFEKTIQAIQHTLGSGSGPHDVVPFNKKGQYTEQLDLIQENAAAEEKASQQAAAGAIRTGKLFEEAFERRKAMPLADALKEIIGTIEKLEAHQKGLNKDASDYVQKYDDLGKKIEANEKQLRGLLAASKERAEFDKANAANLEDQKTEAQKIEEELEHINSELQSMGVTARTPLEVFAAGERMVGEMSKRVKELASELAKTESQAKAAADKASGAASPQVQAILANERAAAEARAQGRGHDADLLEKTVTAFKAGASPQDLAELENIRKLYGESQGKQAGSGSGGGPTSQDLIQNALKNAPPGFDYNLSTGELVPKGKPGLSGDAAKAAREAEQKASRDEAEQTRSAGADAEADRKEEVARIRREQAERARKEKEEALKSPHVGAAAESQRKEETDRVRHPPQASAADTHGPAIVEAIKDNTDWLQKLYQQWA